MKIKDITQEGNVIHQRFGQRARSHFYKNPDIEVPEYDANRGSVYHPGISQGEPEPFERFEVEPLGAKSAAIVGITTDGKQVRVSTTTKELADVLADAYNRGGYTDVELQRVPLAPSEPAPQAKPKPHLSLVK